MFRTPSCDMALETIFLIASIIGTVVSVVETAVDNANESKKQEMAELAAEAESIANKRSSEYNAIKERLSYLVYGQTKDYANQGKMLQHQYDTAKEAIAKREQAEEARQTANKAYNKATGYVSNDNLSELRTAIGGMK